MRHIHLRKTPYLNLPTDAIITASSVHALGMHQTLHTLRVRN